MGGRADLFRAGLAALYYSGAHRLLAPVSQGCGLIFTLHQVSPETPSRFSPNRILKVTPDFLEAVIRLVRTADLDIVALDEAAERLAGGGSGRRFACFTLDDGYRDNLDHAYPVFRRHGVPFTLFVPSDYPDGRGELWWLALETVISGAEEVVLPTAMGEGALPARTSDEKEAAFDALYRWLRRADEQVQRAAVRQLCDRHGVDLGKLCADLIMTWPQIAELARDLLVTIGGHTMAHYALAKLPAHEALKEMIGGADAIERHLGVRPRHFSYPYGDAASAGAREFNLAREAGFLTAVTTRKGVLYPEHRHHLTALPRVSLNGDYQSLRFVELYLTGAPFALFNRFRKVDAA